MNRKPGYLLFGLAAGAATALIGRFVPAVLTIGAGLLLFAAILGTTRSAKFKKSRYVAAAAVCTAGYVLSFLVFNLVMGYAPSLLGASESGDILDFRADVAAGLLAAATPAALTVAVAVAVITKRWSTPLFIQLLVAAIVAISATFIVNLPFHHYWSFVGSLFVTGDALFCWLASTEVMGRPAIAPP